MPIDRRIRLAGRCDSLTGWARSAGLSASTLTSRLANGLSLSAALQSRPMSRAAAGRRGRRLSPWR